MDKLKLHTPDFTDANIARIAELFPNCVTEDKDEKGNLKRSLDFDLLRQELSKEIVEGPQERYHLNWPGKREALLTANAPIAKTLRPCREESVNFDTTQNLFIEGDNLDALKLLQETYLGKVKMIYIDPPYNTGNDFIYDDDFAENSEEYLRKSNQKDEEGNRLVANTDSNGRFHSDWLSMMYSRLKLARNLLQDDGVIFISIDDNEASNLRKVCDEVFGEQNFIACLSAIMNLKGNQDAFGFADTHEYIMCISKNKSSCKLNVFSLEEEELENWEEDDWGLYKKADTLRRTGQDASRGSRPKGWFPVFIDRNNNVYVTSNDKPREETDVILWPTNEAGDELSWSWGKNKISNEPHNLIVIDGRNGKNIYKKQRPSIGDLPTKKPKSIFYKPDYSTSTATNELKKLLEKKLFDGPKPVPLLLDLSIIGSAKDDIIIDFFSGSATTAHAVMQLNAEDGGNRKVIMVQLDEPCIENSEAFKAGYKTIAEIGKERIRRAGRKIKEENATTAPNLDIGFRVLKVDTSNMQDVYYNPDAYSQDSLFDMTDNIKPDRTEEDLLFQVLLDWGVDLSLPVVKETVAGLPVYFVNDNALAACFVKDGTVTEDFCKELAKRQPLRVVFRDAGFKDDSVKINVEQIFKLMSPHTDVKTI